MPITQQFLEPRFEGYAEKVHQQGTALACVSEHICRQYAGMLSPLVRQILTDSKATTLESAMSHVRLRNALDQWFGEQSEKPGFGNMWAFCSIFHPYTPSLPDFGEKSMKISAQHTREALDALLYTIRRTWHVHVGDDCKLFVEEDKYWISHTQPQA